MNTPKQVNFIRDVLGIDDAFEKISIGKVYI